MASLNALRRAVEKRDDAAALVALHALTPTVPEREEAAALALHLGRPRLTLAWAVDPLLRAAAFLRLGEAARGLAALEDHPDSARPTVLRARARWQLRHPDAAEAARHARTLARRGGDAGALVAAVTLLGEMELAGDARAALRTLAEGLKVAELTGQEADAHLLAVLAHVQGAFGSRDRAARTAEKALARSLPRSPARALALIALGREEEARAGAVAGELGGVWLEPFWETP